VQQTVTLNFKDVLIKGGTLEGFKEQLNLPENPQYIRMTTTAIHEVLKSLVVPA